MTNPDTGIDGSDKLEEHINKETGIISWSELARHFARGVVIHVDAPLDLIDVAAVLANDDTKSLQAWLDTNALRRATDDDARDWTAREPEFWCCVTAPWVLVQENEPKEA